MRKTLWTFLIVIAAFGAFDAQARTVHRCVLDGSVSLSTAPEPGSVCTAMELDDTDPKAPNLWGSLGEFDGTLFKREQDGQTVYGTRALPGSEVVLGFRVKTPASAPVHAGLGRIGSPRLDAFAAEFRASAKASGVDDAWLRAVAHAESSFDPRAESIKGAQGVMQLMPATAAEYGVSDPFAAAESIRGGAMHLRMLMKRYEGNLTLVAAAYNAGIGALERYGGVPPYPETVGYVAKVLALHQSYRQALTPRGGGSGAGAAP